MWAARTCGKSSDFAMLATICAKNAFQSFSTSFSFQNIQKTEKQWSIHITWTGLFICTLEKNGSLSQKGVGVER